MTDPILRKFFLGFIQIHILYHGNCKAFYGSWMIEELKNHGYDISPGTLYPLLHRLESDGMLVKEEKIIDGKIRKYYQTTEKGTEILHEARRKAKELFNEIN